MLSGCSDDAGTRVPERLRGQVRVAVDVDGVTGRQLAHGYTNQSWMQDGLVVKQYEGVDALERLHTEVTALARAADAAPVAPVVKVDVMSRRVFLTFLAGRHGQDLVDEGRAVEVLGAAGRTLRRLNHQAPGLVHGDYGPQNLLVDDARWEVSAVLDWEFAHEGDPVEDLAWAEWIIRMHHASAVEALPALFEGYGHEPKWAIRHEAMWVRCSQFAELCTGRGQPGAAEMWRLRVQETRSWSE
jgi:tRNA A-37 threonylcarbamoyl transferase component Bud32